MLIDVDKNDLLAKLPWTPLSASYNKQLYIKKLFEDNYYLVLVTDCRNVWLEHVDASAIYERARESEITVDEDKPERLLALVKILRTFLDNIQEVNQSANKTIERLASQKDAMLQLMTMPTSELMIKATQALIAENSGGEAHDAEHVVHNESAGTNYDSPIQEDLIIAAGLQNTLKGRSQPPTSESANAKTNKEIEQEKRAALRMAMAEEESKRASKKKKLF
ncbi:hypothetical protein NQZ79_g4541 [Umbelopsis isabellina]|nr:hypothetical protein NQZ79_g4541 [Umbelopsis isabellina]